MKKEFLLFLLSVGLVACGPTSHKSLARLPVENEGFNSDMALELIHYIWNSNFYGTMCAEYPILADQENFGVKIAYTEFDPVGDKKPNRYTIDVHILSREKPKVDLSVIAAHGLTIIEPLVEEFFQKMENHNKSE